MIAAIPTTAGRVSPVLDTAAWLLWVTRRSGREGGGREWRMGVLPPSGHEPLARSATAVCGARECL